MFSQEHEEAESLRFAHDENRRLRRALRRNRWFWRGVMGTIVVASVAVAVHDSKTEKTEDEQ